MDPGNQSRNEDRRKPMVDNVLSRPQSATQRPTTGRSQAERHCRSDAKAPQQHRDRGSHHLTPRSAPRDRHAEEITRQAQSQRGQEPDISCRIKVVLSAYTNFLAPFFIKFVVLFISDHRIAGNNGSLPIY